MDLVCGFACGIALSYLIQHLKKLRSFEAGEEEVCNNCSYKKSVMECIQDVQAEDN